MKEGQQEAADATTTKEGNISNTNSTNSTNNTNKINNKVTGEEQIETPLAAKPEGVRIFLLSPSSPSSTSSPSLLLSFFSFFFAVFGIVFAFAFFAFFVFLDLFFVLTLMLFIQYVSDEEQNNLPAFDPNDPQNQPLSFASKKVSLPLTRQLSLLLIIYSLQRSRLSDYAYRPRKKVSEPIAEQQEQQKPSVLASLASYSSDEDE